KTEPPAAAKTSVAGVSGAVTGALARGPGSRSQFAATRRGSRFELSLVRDRLVRLGRGVRDEGVGPGDNPRVTGVNPGPAETSGSPPSETWATSGGLSGGDSIAFKSGAVPVASGKSMAASVTLPALSVTEARTLRASAVPASQRWPPLTLGRAMGTLRHTP